ncbi:uncharacterized protein MKK02DRAFT_37539 [Dioszegia hungarica]|uniref:Retrotransposon gag domain-containing protein n=1 Tax=Dioszegia hungarica TaxID=4972 RepID=A0AA38H8C2_9TREE|nr:uncharacterized protein MKK02DRAFT_37539 [Dioszegia hungarica]KAI9634661.1 hypothetical protein MKK02DRAFT_37539 [Dioszegia hungarica]
MSFTPPMPNMDISHNPWEDYVSPPPGPYPTSPVSPHETFYSTSASPSFDTQASYHRPLPRAQLDRSPSEIKMLVEMTGQLAGTFIARPPPIPPRPTSVYSGPTPLASPFLHPNPPPGLPHPPVGHPLSRPVYDDYLGPLPAAPQVYRSVTPHPRYHAIQTPAPFDGTNQKLAEAFVQVFAYDLMVNAREYAQFPGEECTLVYRAGQCLTGDAQSWFKRWSGDLQRRDLRFKEFERVFMKAWGEVNTAAQANEALLKCKLCCFTIAAQSSLILVASSCDRQEVPRRGG